MITYWVRFQRIDAPQNTLNDASNPWDYARNATARRDELFKLDETVRRCWVERIDRVCEPNGLVNELSKSRYGAVLSR